MTCDYVECEAEAGFRCASMFGVAWGVIPECDLGSEFMRFLGPSRGWLLAAWRWFFPRWHEGSVSYLPHPGIANPAPPAMPHLQVMDDTISASITLTPRARCQLPG